MENPLMPLFCKDNIDDSAILLRPHTFDKTGIFQLIAHRGSGSWCNNESFGDVSNVQATYKPELEQQ
ncbi:hypothetical protein D3C76_1700450 [compost metagenome]